MTNLKTLMEEATPPGDSYEYESIASWEKAERDYEKATKELRDRMVNALPAVLEYMKHGHHYACTAGSFGCDCGYDELRAALGGE